MQRKDYDFYERQRGWKEEKKQFMMRMLEHEWMMLEQKAYEFNITKTEFLRQIILFGGVKKTAPRIKANIILELHG